MPGGTAEDELIGRPGTAGDCSASGKISPADVWRAWASWRAWEISPGRTSFTDTARSACFTKVEAGCFTSARSPSTMTASIFSLNCLRKGSMSAWVVR